MSDKYIHGCWATGTDRVCEDGTKGCSRVHPLRADLDALRDVAEAAKALLETCECYGSSEERDALKNALRAAEVLP